MSQASTIPHEQLTKLLKSKSRSQWVAGFAKVQMLNKLKGLKLG